MHITRGSKAFTINRQHLVITLSSLWKTWMQGNSSKAQTCRLACTLHNVHQDMFESGNLRMYILCLLAILSRSTHHFTFTKTVWNDDGYTSGVYAT